MSVGGEGIYNHQRPKSPWWVWLLPLPLVWWAAIALACRWQPGQNLAGLLATLTEALNKPLSIHWSEQAPRFLMLFSLAYAVTVLVVTADQKNYRRGEEHGSARWGSVYDIAKRYRDQQNLILTKHFSIELDGRKHRRNLNVLVIGGTGAGKSRSHALPNILQGCCSYVITDPKGELLRKT